MSALVSLVSAGPGDPSLITLAGVVALERARVVICDALEHRAWIAHAPADATIVDASLAPFSGFSEDDWVAFIDEHARGQRALCWLLSDTARARAMTIAARLNGDRTTREARCSLVGFDHGAAPLRELNVAITRPRAQQRTLSTLLRANGAQSWDFAAIEVRPAPDRAALLSAVARTSSANVVVFTSANGVDAFFGALEERGMDARALAPTVVASIGTATTERLRAHGIRADVRGSESVGESLAQAIIERLGPNAERAKVMVVRALRGRTTLLDALRSAGVEAELVCAYDTGPSPMLAGLRLALERGAIDVVTFASGSAVDAVLESLGADALQLLTPVTIATVGPVTTAHANNVGLAVHVQSATPSDEALVAALCDYFAATRGR